MFWVVPLSLFLICGTNRQGQEGGVERMSRGGNGRLGKSEEELAELDKRISETVSRRWREKTPEEMEAFSRTMRSIRRNKTPEEQEEWNRNSGAALSRSWANKSPEEWEEFRKMVRQQWISRSPEVRRSIGEKVSESIKRLWDDTDIYGKERNRKVGKASSEHWASLSLEEKEQFRQRCSENQKAVWSRLTSDERDRWIRNAVEGQKRKPSMPELMLGVYLEENFPSKWTYNGDGGQGVVVGRRVPDFVRSDGTKEVIEIFGAVGFRHYLGEEGEKIKHYEKYGYECMVIWEWDCYLPEELDKLFGVTNAE